MAAKLITAACAALWMIGAPSADAAARAVFGTAANRLSNEVAVAQLLRELRDGAPKGLIRIDNVRTVDPRTGQVTPRSTIIVRGNRIRWVGDTSEAPNAGPVTRIDGKGRFAVPGLTDMHIHSGRADGRLLNLAVGVTTVREMGGFPWLLKARNEINARRMLGPTSYVAGTIIAAEPFFGYAVVAAGPANARAIVRTQAACGYDFVKVHNQLPQPVFDAVADQAARSGLHLVGHVPHDMTVRHAVQAGKMRTTEHLKGFLNDRTLLPANEDYSAALARAETWITPTLYTRRSYERGSWARSFMAGPLVRYVPPAVRDEWRDALAADSADDRETGARFVNTQTQVMAKLRPLRPRWLTGTDAAGYKFNIMGFALLDEMALMRESGLTAAEVYRASTIEAAEAMGEAEEFGAIRKGMRADIVLLDKNPLLDGEAFDKNYGVMAHGVWLDRGTLDRALSELANLYASNSRRASLSHTAALELTRGLETATSGGFVFNDAWLEAFSQELRTAGLGQLGDRVEALQANSGAGVCSVPNPPD